MTIDTIVALPAIDAQWDDLNPQPAQSVLMDAYNDGIDKQAYLVANYNAPDWPISTYIVGAWDRSTGLQEGQSYDIDGTTVIGTPTHPLQSDYFDYIRPLGNNDNGSATGELDSMRWQGAPEQKYAQDDNRYPASNRPFDLLITRQAVGVGALPWDSGTTYNTGDFAESAGSVWESSQDNNLNNTPFGGSPFWDLVSAPGWGWRVDMISDDPLRDITVRAIGVYSDPECTQYLYTTGAFIDDGSGNYFTECPAGQRTGTPDPVYFALLWASVQEGFFQLIDEADGAEGEALFWSNLQATAAGPQGYDWMKVQANGGNYGGYLSSGTLHVEDPSPDGFVVDELYITPNDRLVLELSGNNQDTLDPTVTFVRIDAGTEIDVPMTWNAGQSAYRSAAIVGFHQKAMEHENLYVLLNVSWA